MVNLAQVIKPALLLSAVVFASANAAVTLDVSVDSSKAYPISKQLVGIFFEDINYAADGGLYAELVQNRSFDYTPMDRAEWTPLTAWSLVAPKQRKSALHWDMSDPLNANNPTYAMLLVGDGEGYAGIENRGFDGIALQQGEPYQFSVFARQLSNTPGPLLVQLLDNHTVVASAETPVISQGWQQYQLTLTPNKTVSNGSLRVMSAHAGYIGLDMVSLFPTHTFNNRSNGLRKDLAEALKAMQPRFIRFPGGCLVHGDGIDNMYQWKHTIGPVAQRKAQRNIWSYHQTNGLGYYEYFQLAEDLGAIPLPILPAAVTCQNSGARINGFNGKGQVCVLLDNMPAFIQDIMDLIEWANGPATSMWGKLRADAGHPEPFNLQYIGIGNEDVISEDFNVRFNMIYQALKRQHPEITVVGTAGPFPEGEDYEQGWKLADKLQVPLIDEHMYRPPQWFWDNLHRYDSYDRKKSAVYVGEWAAHVEDRSSNVEAALAEAAYLTSLERNGDIVKFSSYAPLFANVNNTMWRPDLIYFDNQSVTLTPSYYVQALFGQHAISEFLPYKMAKPEGRLAISVGKNTDNMVVKLVNGEAKTVSLKLSVAAVSDSKLATVTQLQGDNALALSFKRSVSQQQINPTEQLIELPPLSVTNIEWSLK